MLGQQRPDGGGRAAVRLPPRGELDGDMQDGCTCLPWNIRLRGEQQRAATVAAPPRRRTAYDLAYPLGQVGPCCPAPVHGPDCWSDTRAALGWSGQLPVCAAKVHGQNTRAKVHGHTQLQACWV